MAFMNVTEILQFVDGLVYQHTGKHLDNVQKAVVKGSCEGDTYNEIAENNHLNKTHVGDVGGDLWKLLSEILNENIKKSNFLSTFERLNLESSPNSLLNNVMINSNNNNNFCHTQTFRNSQPENQENNKTKSSYHDLTFAPKILKFYNRETELKKINNYIFNQKIKLISVLGLSGIGKTYLVKRFVDLNLDQFEVIIWKSLNFPKTLDLLLNDLLKISNVETLYATSLHQYNETPLQKSLDDKLNQLFAIFKEKRCLIILDDVQNIFMKGEFSGEYKPEYQNYQNFFTKILETEHQSNIILISQEECAEMRCFNEDLCLINCLKLSGLNEVQFLKNMGLKDEDSWLNLINLYEGNPFYLQTIANSIKNIYDGNVAEFLAENKHNLPLITKDIQARLQILSKKLSSIEQQIVLKLSNFNQPVSREELKIELDLSSTDFINGLESLQQRYLVTKIKEAKILFKLVPVFQEYVRNCCQN